MGHFESGRSSAQNDRTFLRDAKRHKKMGKKIEKGEMQIYRAINILTI